ncbi:Hypothetical protein NGK_1312 [Neisseria gonorrhoeae NCCP11945]|uniref:Uncharacterized protein n=1 Tax=Neisseria gonorrhoeae (strain NCCP11945) TaxID=521006 RepID=B4RMF2_NEIG2|nr:Hypothetical protein NGK_1312 [Neisseria gonorrhoeae NCCP11945]
MVGVCSPWHGRRVNKVSDGTWKFMLSEAQCGRLYLKI